MNFNEFSILCKYNTKKKIINKVFFIFFHFSFEKLK